MLRALDADPAARGAWDAFVAAAPSGSFLQSWMWGDFQEVAGFHVHRVRVVNETDVLRGTCLLVERPLPLGKRSVYAPWGPVVFGGEQAVHEVRDVLRALAVYLRTGTAGSVVSLRVEPKLPPDVSARTALTEAGYDVLDRGVQPRDTLVLDLTQTEDDLLRQMHPKTRYNIRVALRHEVTVEERTTAEGLDMFWSLAQEIERRGQFHYHPREYYDTMLETLGHRAHALRILVAFHKGTPLAAGLFIRFGDVVTYAHGASTTARAHVMAPTLLHWEALLRAKAAGARTYDFFGIDARGGIEHPWAGITRFKRGFGGREEHWIGAADTVFDPLAYRLYTIARGMRRLLQR